MYPWAQITGFPACGFSNSSRLSVPGKFRRVDRMTIKPELRQRVLKSIVQFRKWGQKKVAAMVRTKSVYYLLSNEDRPAIQERKFHQALADLEARSAHAAVTAAWLESMQFLEQPEGPRPEERDAVEMALVREREQRRALYLEI